ncbi:superoxide dismutase [Candidatus Berkelbacteria bacterium]|nr:superoxide dismutase [Candidatus Berkelbacteria bacterium]
MSYTLPQLGYAYDALEPVIDAQTMEIHHKKHHQAYIDKLNTVLKSQADLGEYNINALMSQLESIPEEIRMLVRNHGGGHANHSFFWEIMCPLRDRDEMAEKQAKQMLAKVLEENFDSLEKFQAQFTEAALNRFGSGWTWLMVNSLGDLEIASTPNQDNPWMEGKTPILGLDVWEHAYYLKYQNRRADYIEAWWQAVNWPKAVEFLKLAQK